MRYEYNLVLNEATTPDSVRSESGLVAFTPTSSNPA